ELRVETNELIREHSIGHRQEEQKQGKSKQKQNINMEMMRSLRHVNIDHLHVGWYQSTFYGSFVSRALLDSQLSYQHAIEESVVFIYDPLKTAQGSLCLKAYRLTPKLMEICKEKDFSADGLKKASVGFENMFEEVPIVIKNSHLISVLLWELEDKSTAADKHELLNLSSSHLSPAVQLLLGHRAPQFDPHLIRQPTMPLFLFVSLTVSDFCTFFNSLEISFFLTVSRHKLHCLFALNFIFKIFSLGQISTCCQTIKEFTSQNLGKLFMAEALLGTSS
uniref:Eukaryotic translation initiation factor 3 subunit H n=1 Tax=Sinocyclocheilus grahami TaxID=75366 RepID=A0A672KEL1_SINGR